VLTLAVILLTLRDRAVAKTVSALREVVQERLSDRALVEELERSSRTDPLTGLANRRHMQNELPRHLAEADPNFAPLAVALLDLDGFKEYNDANGHLAGDRLLKQIATGWLDQLRDGDLLVRLGGDEFVAILPKCSESNALRVADRLRDTLDEERSCSIGVVCWDGVEGPEDLLARADGAMYESKRSVDRAPVLR
jgi:diguanylate cyclase (GGDEF)-like protein